MKKPAVRFWMIVTAALAGGNLAMLGTVASLPARVAFGVLGGIFAGLTLYLHGRLHRSRTAGG